MFGYSGYVPTVFSPRLERNKPQWRPKKKSKRERESYHAALGEDKENVRPSTEEKSCDVQKMEEPLLGETHQYYIRGKRYITDRHYIMDEKPIGSGAYGDVCMAMDKRYKKKVAIKKITNAFHDLVDAKRILREVKMLAHFSHMNIIDMVDMIPTESGKRFNDVYMVLECMDTDLHKILRDKRYLSEAHMQYFTYQLLCGVNYMHSAGIIHRDLKPSNLLINLSDCRLKICDFGLSRPLHWDGELTEYVVTRWYRAPEIMLGCKNYDEKVDVWSIGCIVAELIKKVPLFKGKHYIEQLRLILQFLGTPRDPRELDWLSNKKAKEFIRNMNPCHPCSLRTKFHQASPLAIELLSKLLVFNPHRRCSIEYAMSHAFVQKFRREESESLCKEKLKIDYENRVDTAKQLRAEMKKEIIKCRRASQKLWAAESAIIRI